MLAVAFNNNENLVEVGEINEDIIKTAAGNGHCLLLTKSGKVFGYGRNNFNQLTEHSS